MVEQLKQKLRIENKIAGVEIYLTREGPVCSYCILLLKQGTVIKEQSGASLSFEQLLEQIPRDIPLALLIHGKGVLYKTIPGDVPDEKLIRHLFPNVNPEDFLFERLPREKANDLVALVRKDLLTEHISRFREKGYRVLSAGAGPLSVVHIWPLLEAGSEEGKLLIKEYDFGFSGGRLESLNLRSDDGHQAQEQKFMIGEEPFEESLILSYAAAFQALIPGIEAYEVHLPEIEYDKSEWKQQRIFKVAGLGMLAFFFLVLLINYLVFTGYEQDKQQLSQKVSAYQYQLNQLDSLKKEYQNKKEFLENTGWISASGVAFYSDRLAASVPEAVQMIKMAIHPLNEEKSRKEKRKVFNTGTILLEGRCRRSTVLNGWIRRLQKKEWTKKVAIRNYHFDKREESGRFVIGVQLQ